MYIYIYILIFVYIIKVNDIHVVYLVPDRRENESQQKHADLSSQGKLMASAGSLAGWLVAWHAGLCLAPRAG